MTKQISLSTSQWNKEFASGMWNYLDKSSSERARHEIIGMFCQQYSPKGRILDVGCGEGTLADFLNPAQKRKYLGIDISKEALKIGRQKRDIHFQLTDAESFHTSQKFDVIIFNEMLYYVDDKKILEKFSHFLNKGGLTILSVYRMKTERYDQQILKHAKVLLDPMNAVEVIALTKRKKVTWHIEVFAQKKP